MRRNEGPLVAQTPRVVVHNVGPPREGNRKQCPGLLPARAELHAGFLAVSSQRPAERRHEDIIQRDASGLFQRLQEGELHFGKVHDASLPVVMHKSVIEALLRVAHVRVKGRHSKRQHLEECPERAGRVRLHFPRA
eukprot:scaffold442_cov268-Pinguiococcus_pyrenoidosus.AAC.78